LPSLSPGASISRWPLANLSRLVQRPFLNYYGNIFVLYELSTLFLNVHWFFDKLEMTGSRAQLYNGLALLATFFGCRLVWGTIQSARVWADMWRAVHSAPDAGYIAAAFEHAGPDRESMAFAAAGEPLPVWLALLYLTSNLVLNALNWHWFFKMIAAVRKRFEPAKEEEEQGQETEKAGEQQQSTKGLTTAKDVVRPQGLRKRGHSIEDIVPDSEELRQGRIQ
jgi:hypothetical protein